MALGRSKFLTTCWAQDMETHAPLWLTSIARYFGLTFAPYGHHMQYSLPSSVTLHSGSTTAVFFLPTQFKDTFNTRIYHLGELKYVEFCSSYWNLLMWVRSLVFFNGAIGYVFLGLTLVCYTIQSSGSDLQFPDRQHKTSVHWVWPTVTPRPRFVSVTDRVVHTSVVLFWLDVLVLLRISLLLLLGPRSETQWLLSHLSLKHTLYHRKLFCSSAAMLSLTTGKILILFHSLLWYNNFTTN